jgi:enoyl-CoA hydratase/carnithine racemase
MHVGGGVAAITLRRPARRNAICEEMWDEFLRKLRHASTDESVRVVIIRGAGGDFSAGADLREMGAAELPEAERLFHKMEECVASVEECPVPTIACISGYALGTGLELALACDLRVADGSARLGIPIARLGITLSSSFVRRLTLLIGPSRTKDLVYTGRMLDAQEALDWVLVNRVVSEEESALHETFEIARTIGKQSRASLRAVKAKAGSGSGRNPAAYNYVDPEDFPEGVSAFLEKRTPRFG